MEPHRCEVCGLFQDAVGQTLDEFLNVLNHALRYQCQTCGQLWAYHLMAHPHENARRAEPCSGVT